jgi:hypothetical protein
MPFYGYRLNEQKDWVKMKTFDTIEEYKQYVERRHIKYAMCSNKEIDLRGNAASETYDSNSDWVCE